MTIEVTRYSAPHRDTWNRFLHESKTPSFLFDRYYMEYHEDRFHDHSILIFEDKSLMAIFPANEKDTEIQSHGGLSYGGLVLAKHVKLVQVLGLFHHLLRYYLTLGFESLSYKCTPSYITIAPSEEEKYAMFRLNAVLARRDPACVLRLDYPIGYQLRRVRSIKKAQQKGAWIRETKNPDHFWNAILTPTLRERHGISPVHSLEEIKLLMSRFPDNIRLFEAGVENEVSAGALVFDKLSTAHAQYIATNPQGRQAGTLDFLFDGLIKNYFRHKKYFSLGISTEDAGKKINSGLQDWKEGFGSQTFALDFYTVPTKNFNLLADYA